MSTTYDDHRIACTEYGVKIRGYYFPWGSKSIPYSRIKVVRRVNVGALSGRFRIWGTGNPRYWANFDMTRPKKTKGLIIDTGRLVKPFITPDDTDAVVSVLREVGVAVSDDSSKARLV